MAAFDNAFSAFNNFSNTVTTGTDQLLKKQADYDISTMHIQLQREANAKMLEIEQNSNWQDWEQNIDDYFTKVEASMSDRNSRYYCQNQLTARMATQMVNQARNQYQYKAAQQAAVFQQKKYMTDFNDTTTGILQMYKGQEAYDMCLAKLDQLKDVARIDPQEEENIKTYLWQQAAAGEYNSYFDEIKLEAVNAGKTAEEVWSIVDYKCKDKVQRKNGDGVAIPNYGSGAWREQQKKDFVNQYNAYQYEIQSKNQDWFDSDINNQWTNIANLLNGDTSVSIDKIRIGIERGLNRNNRTAEYALPNKAKAQNTEEYKSMITKLNSLEEAVRTGNGGKLISELFNDKTVKPLMDAACDKFIKGSKSEYGGTTSGYDTWNYFQDTCLKEYSKVTGIQNPTWNDIEDAAPVVATFFDYIEQKFPPSFNNVMSSVKNAVQFMFDTKSDQLPDIMNLVRDTMLELDVSDMTDAQQQEVAKRLIQNVNSMYGKDLNKNKAYNAANPGMFEGYNDLSALRNLKETTGNKQEGKVAAAMVARDSNVDLVNTDEWGNPASVNGDNSVRNGLTYLEAFEKNYIKDKIQQETGKNIDISTIHSDYEADGTYDKTARKVYTVDGVDYRFHSEDGKHVIMERKKTGTTDWETVTTAKQENAKNTPEQVSKRKTAEIREEYKTKDTASKMPPVEYYQGMGDSKWLLTEKEWRQMSEGARLQIIKELTETHREEMEAWKKQLDDKPEDAFAARKKNK